MAKLYFFEVSIVDSNGSLVENITGIARSIGEAAEGALKLMENKGTDLEVATVKRGPEIKFGADFEELVELGRERSAGVFGVFGISGYSGFSGTLGQVGVSGFSGICCHAGSTGPAGPRGCDRSGKHPVHDSPVHGNIDGGEHEELKIYQDPGASVGWTYHSESKLGPPNNLPDNQAEVDRAVAEIRKRIEAGQAIDEVRQIDERLTTQIPLNADTGELKMTNGSLTIDGIEVASGLRYHTMVDPNAPNGIWVARPANTKPEPDKIVYAGGEGGMMCLLNRSKEELAERWNRNAISKITAEHVREITLIDGEFNVSGIWPVYR